MLIGFLGLGKMGGRMVKKLVEEGHSVIAWNRNYAVAEELVKQYSSRERSESRSLGNSSRLRSNNITAAKTIKELVGQLESPRIIWLMLPAGDATESVLSEVKKYLQKGDIVVDGANSFYKDTQKRSEEFEKLGIQFLGIGVSGGILAPDNGFPLMVGGNMSAYRYIETVLNSLAKPNGGHEYFGKGGAGHYIKMVHNGIEYGMMQAIGEGFGVLDKGPYTLDLEKVANLWTKGTIVAGFLLDRARDALQKDSTLEKTVGFIEENGEAKWTISLAKKLKLPIQVIEDSLRFRIDSQKSKKIQNSFAAKMVAALRHEFGGHKVKER